MVWTGVTHIDYDDKPAYGFEGFIYSLIVYCILLPLGATLWCWAVLAPGLWLHSKYQQAIQVFLLKRRGTSM